MSQRASKKSQKASKKAEAEFQKAAAPLPSSQPTSPSIQKSLSKLVKAAAYLAITAIFSNVSQLSLSPVYGSIPSELYHNRGVQVVFVLAWLTRKVLRNILPRNLAQWIPIHAFWIPTLLLILFGQSSLLGATWGPLVTEAITFYPLLALAIYSSAPFLESQSYGWTAEVWQALGSYKFFRIFEDASGTFIGSYIGTNAFMTRSGLQFVCATLYAGVAPSKRLIFVLPSILYSAIFNVHTPLPRNTALLNSTLFEQTSYRILAREESLTGYISVLENKKDGFLALRCDHSLLGGEWLPRGNGYGASVREPIYAIFVMLEAVRLFETDPVLEAAMPAAANAPIERSDSGEAALPKYGDDPASFGPENGEIVEEMAAEDVPEGYWGESVSVEEKTRLWIKGEEMKKRILDKQRKNALLMYAPNPFHSFGVTHADNTH
jgi:hypothetical protein